jgi:hypothetical protein
MPKSASPLRISSVTICATLAQVKFDAGKSPAVVRDQAGKNGACKRNHARDHDLAAWLSGHLPHVFGADPEIIEQPLRQCGEFLSGVRDGDLAGTAGKQRHPSSISISLIVRVSAGCDIFSELAAATKLRYLASAKNGLELPRTQVGEDMTGHAVLAIDANTGIISVIGNKLQ